MSPLFFIPLVYLAALVQTWFVPRWQAFEAAPNLLVLIAFLWLTQTPSRRGLLMAALAGLTSDLNAPTPLGLRRRGSRFAPHRQPSRQPKRRGAGG